MSGAPDTPCSVCSGLFLFKLSGCLGLSTSQGSCPGGKAFLSYHFSVCLYIQWYELPPQLSLLRYQKGFQNREKGRKSEGLICRNDLFCFRNSTRCVLCKSLILLGGVVVFVLFCLLKSHVSARTAYAVFLISQDGGVSTDR